MMKFPAFKLIIGVFVLILLLAIFYSDGPIRHCLEVSFHKSNQVTKGEIIQIVEKMKDKDNKEEKMKRNEEEEIRKMEAGSKQIYEELGRRTGTRKGRGGKVYDLRRELVKRHCAFYRKHGMLNRVINWPSRRYGRGHGFLYAARRKVIMKIVPKCGYTTWIQHLRRFRSKTGGIYRKMFALKNRSSIRSFWSSLHKNGFVSFMFTRHPFSRILSAYKNKMEPKLNGKVDEPFRLINNKIAEHYRGTEEFNYYSTFPQFIQAVLNDYIEDMHWKPISQLVYPCDFDYTVIGTMETFEEDVRYIKKLTNMTGIQTEFTANQSSKKKSEAEYYSMINKTDLIRLYKKFIVDFQIYGYQYEDYLTYVKVD